jgi:hypothetical protein
VGKQDAATTKPNAQSDALEERWCDSSECIGCFSRAKEEGIVAFLGPFIDVVDAICVVYVFDVGCVFLCVEYDGVCGRP